MLKLSLKPGQAVIFRHMDRGGDTVTIGLLDAVENMARVLINGTLALPIHLNQVLEFVGHGSARCTRVGVGRVEFAFDMPPVVKIGRDFIPSHLMAAAAQQTVRAA